MSEWNMSFSCWKLGRLSKYANESVWNLWKAFEKRLLVSKDQATMSVRWSLSLWSHWLSSCWYFWTKRKERSCHKPWSSFTALVIAIFFHCLSSILPLLPFLSPFPFPFRFLLKNNHKTIKCHSRGDHDSRVFLWKNSLSSLLPFYIFSSLSFKNVSTTTSARFTGNNPFKTFYCLKIYAHLFCQIFFFD